MVERTITIRQLREAAHLSLIHGGEPRGTLFQKFQSGEGVIPNQHEGYVGIPGCLQDLGSRFSSPRQQDSRYGPMGQGLQHSAHL